MSKKPKPSPVTPSQTPLVIKCREGENAELAGVRALTGSVVSNALIVSTFGKSTVGIHNLNIVCDVLKESTQRIKDNDLQDVEAMLISQAAALNVMFCECTKKASQNMGEYMQATESYMRMALKAQNQCRATLETLAQIKNPPVVYARQANIANGLQQVNNTLHAPAQENSIAPNKLLEECHEQRLDTRAQATSSTGYPHMETVDASDGSTK
jgi:hypothetical protein